MDKKFWATTFTLSGTIIGAGILGLPYVIAQSGYLIGIFWLILFGAIMTLVNLYLAETTLRTKGKHQLAGYAEKYLGKTTGKIMFFATIFGVYSALLAYLVGEGESLSQIFTGSTQYALIFGIAFWLILTVILQTGLKGLKKIETWGVLFIIGISVALIVTFIPEIQIGNLAPVYFTNALAPFGVIIFAFLGFTSIPELRLEIKGKEKLLQKAVILGTAIPLVIYILFTTVFIGVLGNQIDEVATLSLGPLVNILGILTMLTSYLVLSFSLRDLYLFDEKFSKKQTFFFASILPLLIYLATEIFSLANFTQILSIGGVISGGLTGILILMMNQKAKQRGTRKPEFSIPLNKITRIILTTIFVLGVIFESL